MAIPLFVLPGGELIVDERSAPGARRTGGEMPR